MTTSWTNINTNSSSWTNVPKPTISSDSSVVYSGGEAIGLLLALTYTTVSSVSGATWSNINKASNTSWTNIAKAT